MYPSYADYDHYLDHQERCARFVEDMEHVHQQALADEAEWELWCWQHGQYELPHEYYLGMCCPLDWTPTIHTSRINHDQETTRS